MANMTAGSIQSERCGRGAGDCRNGDQEAPIRSSGFNSASTMHFSVLTSSLPA